MADMSVLILKAISIRQRLDGYEEKLQKLSLGMVRALVTARREGETETYKVLRETMIDTFGLKFTNEIESEVAMHVNKMKGVFCLGPGSDSGKLDSV